jgi:hypothetical protein
MRKQTSQRPAELVIPVPPISPRSGCGNVVDAFSRQPLCTKLPAPTINNSSSRLKEPQQPGNKTSHTHKDSRQLAHSLRPRMLLPHAAPQQTPAPSRQHTRLLHKPSQSQHSNAHSTHMCIECTSPPYLPPIERDNEGGSPARLLGRNWGGSHAMAPCAHVLAGRQRTSLIPCKVPSIPQARQAPKIWEYPFWCQSPPNMDENTS